MGAKAQWRHRDEVALHRPMAATVDDYYVGRTWLILLIAALCACVGVCGSYAIRRWDDPASATRVRWCVQVILPAALALNAYLLHSLWRVIKVITTLRAPGYHILTHTHTHTRAHTGTHTHTEAHTQSNDAKNARSTTDALAECQDVAAEAIVPLMSYSADHAATLRTLVELSRACVIPRSGATARLCAAGPVILRAEYSERLGNNVLQYITSRLRARYIGCTFEAPRLGAPFDRACTRVYACAHSTARTDASLLVDCDRTLSPFAPSTVEAWTPDAQALLRSQQWRECWAAWLLHPASGYVMNSAMFIGHEHDIKSWFAESLAHYLMRHMPPPASAAVPTDSSAAPPSTSARRRRQSKGHASVPAAALPVNAEPELDHADDAMVSGWAANDVAMHVRLGDILWGHHAAYRPLPTSLYRRALQIIADRLGTAAHGAGIGTVVIVTEDRTHEIIARTAQFIIKHRLARRVRLQSSSLVGDFLTLYSAPNVVISISSFAWCAGFFGKAGTVIYPRYGLLRPQVWWPTPSVPAIHDLTLRDGDWMPELQAEIQKSAAGRTSAREPAPSDDAAHLAALIASQSAARDVVVPRKEHQNSAESTAPLTMQAYVPALAVLQNATGSAEVMPARLAGAVAEATRKYHEQIVSASPRVVEIDVPYLQRWDGDFRHTLESLFDDEA